MDSEDFNRVFDELYSRVKETLNPELANDSELEANLRQCFTSSESIDFLEKLKKAKEKNSFKFRTLDKIIEKSCSPEEYIHFRNVAEWSKKIGECLDVPENDLYRLRFAGLLHDIGKVLIPTDLVGKSLEEGTHELKLVRYGHVILGQLIMDYLGIEKGGLLYSAVVYHHELKEPSSDRIRTHNIIPFQEEQEEESCTLASLFSFLPDSFMRGKNYAINGFNLYDLSRIVELADSFMASIEESRDYRKKQTPFEAVSTLAKEGNFSEQYIGALGLAVFATYGKPF